jgi:3-methyladenine DNA glycosylase AlkD
MLSAILAISSPSAAPSSVGVLPGGGLERILGGAMSHENTEFLRQGYEALPRGDLETFMALSRERLDREFVFHSVWDGRVFKGRGSGSRTLARSGRTTNRRCGARRGQRRAGIPRARGRLDIRTRQGGARTVIHFQSGSPRDRTAAEVDELRALVRRQRSAPRTAGWQLSLLGDRRASLDRGAAVGGAQRVAALKRSGAASPAFGVSLSALRALAKRIGHDHDLALALWPTGVREARILASLIDERERVTRAQMDRWAETFDSWEICDQCCQNLFAHTAFALDKAVEWTRRPEEFMKRAAFVLVAVRAVHDKGADDRPFADLLPTLIAAADDERLYVRKGASWALRQIGKRSDRLQTRVLAAVGPYIDADGRGIRWVARDVSRELRSRT